MTILEYGCDIKGEGASCYGQQEKDSVGDMGAVPYWTRTQSRRKCWSNLAWPSKMKNEVRPEG
jgi:hypothetical protein